MMLVRYLSKKDSDTDKPLPCHPNGNGGNKYADGGLPNASATLSIEYPVPNGNTMGVFLGRECTSGQVSSS
jgi:hypothetical protein